MKVEKSFLEIIAARYGAALGSREVAKVRRQYVNKNYNTRRLSTQLRRIYNDLLTTDDPVEIRRLRSEYLSLREQIAQIKEARNNDPVYQELSGKIKALNDALKYLDEMILQKLKEYGYEVKPMTVEEVEAKIRAKIREFSQNSRMAVASAGEAEP